VVYFFLLILIPISYKIKAGVKMLLTELGAPIADLNKKINETWRRL